MSRFLQVAHTEILEQRRQSSMLFILAFNYFFWGAIFLFSLFIFSTVHKDPQALEVFESQAAVFGICNGESASAAMLKLLTSSFGAILFTNLSLFVAIMSGYSVINDRLNGTLPFLMLAPLTRYQLLLGKLLGSMAIPSIMHLFFMGIISFLALQFDIIDPFRAQFGDSTAWWIAYVFGAPASGFFIGSIGTLVSALSKDVRTSMQYTSFIIGIFSLICGYILFDGIRSGAIAELLYTSVVLFLGIIILALGSRIISRELY